MKLRIVLHGENIEEPGLREAVDDLRTEGHEVEVRVTWERGDARRFAAEAGPSVGVVVAAGGDGTLSEVASGLCDASGQDGPALGVLPLGTANDFAHASGVPQDDIEAALGLIVAGAPGYPLDLIAVGGRTVINVATGGFGAQVTAETPDGLKRVLGGLSYAVAGVSRISELEATAGSVRGPDFEWSGRFLAVAVGNGTQAGGGIRLCPDALVDDGLLDLRVVPEGRGAGRLLLEALVKGRETVLDEASFAHRAPWVEIETEAPFQVNLDGEPMVGTSFRFEVRPGALRCVLPEGSPLRSSSGLPPSG